MTDGNPLSPRVLLIDDDELVLAVLHTALVREGYLVRDAPTAAEAMRLLAIQPVDVVVLDAHIPGSELETNLRAIGSISPAPTIIVLSGTQVDPGLLEGAGASYLAKPVDALVFLSSVAEASGRR
jgi:CheY-like chemotaxis protein